MKVVSFNLWGPQQHQDPGQLERQAAMLAQLRPDVLLLQEVGGEFGPAGRDHLAVLAAACQLDHMAFGVLHNDDFAEWGNAIACRWPLENIQVIKAPKPRNFFGLVTFSRRRQDRGAIEASCVVDGQPYRLVSTHLSSNWPRYRRTHARQIVRRLSRLQPEVAVVLGLDANDRPTSLPVRILGQRLFDTAMLAAADNLMAIDFVLLGNNHRWNVTAFSCIPTRTMQPQLSDHDAVVAEISSLGVASVNSTLVGPGPRRVTCKLTVPGSGVVLGYGGLEADGNRWQLLKGDMIKSIRMQNQKYLVTAIGSPTPVQVVEVASRRGRLYLRTPADNVLLNNLGWLPRC